MRDEVFGPLLSIVSVDDVTRDGINLVHSKEKPLSLYIFSNNKSFVENIVAKTDAGGVCVNDVVTQFSFHGFPFGGTGNSGMGRYHGWYSFKAFSHEKPVLHKYAGGEKINDIRVPPFTDWKARVYRSIMEEKPSVKLLSFVFFCFPICLFVYLFNLFIYLLLCWNRIGHNIFQ